MAAEETYKIHWEGTPNGVHYLQIIRALYRYFGEKTLVSRIDTEDVDAFIAYLRSAGNSNGTINRKLACLSKILTEAEIKGKIPKKPRIRRQREMVGRIRWLDDLEEAVLLQLLRQWELHDQADCVEVLIDTGMRPSELRRVMVRDVDFEGGFVRVWETKNYEPRSIPMTSRVTAIMARRVAQKQPRDVLFPYDKEWLRRHWDRARSVKGLMDDPQFVPYVCRHTCASRLVKGGVPLGVIQKWMGHKSIQMTMRYAHLSPTDLLRGVPVLERHPVNRS
ncbi:MAG: site-specific integrase [Ectothiorhodospiraceae bacterium]|nr:site-specific integrase [Ectothiorhodospiraceae bacterium]